MSELYLEDLADKTHRGQTGRALAGASAGGLAYGYQITTTGQRQINPDQARVVTLIYTMAANGHTVRQIAAHLNDLRIPSPRGSSWAISAIYGDKKRGIGILANPLYRGRMIWNRTQWIKHPETGRRVPIQRPESEWIITEHPDLRIISEQLAEAAERALSQRRAQYAGHRPGPGPKHLLSGLLRCAECGGPLVSIDRYRYGCGRAKDRGPSVCASTIKVPRAHAEKALLSTIKTTLLTETAYREFERQARAALAQAAPNTSALQAALRQAQATHENILSALRAGIITASTKAELIAAEHALASAKADLEHANRNTPSQILPRARETWRRLVSQLENARDIPEVRSAIRDLLGDRIIVKEDAPGEVFAECDAGASQILLVAGAGFEPTTFGL